MTLLIAANSYALFGMESSYQHDADIFRLRHLKYYGENIQEYHEKTGEYPLQGESEKPNYVHIAAPHQQKYAKGISGKLTIYSRQGAKNGKKWPFVLTFSATSASLAREKIVL